MGDRYRSSTSIKQQLLSSLPFGIASCQSSGWQWRESGESELLLGDHKCVDIWKCLVVGVWVVYEWLRPIVLRTHTRVYACMSMSIAVAT